MSKFNQANTMRTQNKSGNAAYKMADKDKLITQVLTSFFNEKKYYGDNSKEIVSTLESVCKSDADFVAKLGIFARKEFNMRSISHVIAAVLAHDVNGKMVARKYIKNVCIRADDMTEILSCYISMYGKPIPNSMKKGLADALRKFDEYALAKYDRSGSVKIRDIIQIAHPIPQNKEQGQLWKRALERNLEVPNTWEVQLSTNGNTKETWEKLIDDNALGYMAMLRNLRNMIEKQPNNLDKVYNALRDPERVRKSRQLPFRFYSAYRRLVNEPNVTGRTMDILEDALEISTENIEKITGKTLIAIDTSASMGSTISKNSETTCRDIACLIGAMANKICEESIVVTFDTELNKFALSTRNGIIANANSVKRRGGGTDMELPYQYLINHNIDVDRVIVLSDNEVNDGWYGGPKVTQSLADAYRKHIGHDVWVHAIDMQGYGTQQFMGKHTNIIAGWSEKVLDFIKLAEDGTDTLKNKIESIEL